MAKSTDKYYEIDRSPALKAQTAILEILSESDEKSLTMEDINALGRFLAYRRERDNTAGQYEAIVDYLWMSYRIDLQTKLRLLELAESQGNEGGK